MKILITNHQLINYAGTEVFVFTLAELFKQKGHEVAIYSAYIGDIRKVFDALGVMVTDKLDSLPEDFDIAHVHHNINAYEIRNRYPQLPIVYMAHGIRDPLEHLPLTNLGIAKFLAGSDGIRDYIMSCGISANMIEIFRNPVDERKFFPEGIIKQTPTRALVISNKIDGTTEQTIRQACQELNIECRFIGSRFENIPNHRMPGMINQSDIVFSLGRGAIEAMFCGRIPIVFDCYGGDGMVTPDNFNEIIKRNFSGKCYNRQFGVDDLVKEVGKYKSEYGAELHTLALQEFSAERQVEKLIGIYSECVNQEFPALTDYELQLIKSVCEMIDQTRIFARRDGVKEAHEQLVYELGGEKVFQLFRSLGKMRYKLIPENSRGTKALQRFTRGNKSERA